MNSIIGVISSRWTANTLRRIPHSSSVLSFRWSSSEVAKTGDDGNKDVTANKKPETKADAPHKMVLKKRYADNPVPLMDFFDSIPNWGEQRVRSGREWRVEELRIKSNEDLHKLWYVLLKERNMLLTMKEEAKDQNELFPSPERMDRVEQSMINLETVVRERNKAYMELEVGEGETAERPAYFRRDMFGDHRMVGASEHLIPYHLNTKWRTKYGPGHGKYVNDFVRKWKEKKAKKVIIQTYKDYTEVRQLLRRFPDMDVEVLQEKYPKVPVKYFKENLEYYEDRHTYSPQSMKYTPGEKDPNIKC